MSKCTFEVNWQKPANGKIAMTSKMLQNMCCCCCFVSAWARTKSLFSVLTGFQCLSSQCPCWSIMVFILGSGNLSYFILVSATGHSPLIKSSQRWQPVMHALVSSWRAAVARESRRRDPAVNPAALFLLRLSFSFTAHAATSPLHSYVLCDGD